MLGGGVGLAAAFERGGGAHSLEGEEAERIRPVWISLVSIGSVLTIVGLGLTAGEHMHTLDAVNIYNDTMRAKELEERRPPINAATPAKPRRR